MSPAVARPLIHTIHLLTFLILFTTGLLLWLPALRSAVTGGYAQTIRETHQWGGVAFVLLPIAVIAYAGIRNVFVRPAERRLRTRWQGLHLMLTVVMSVVLTVTGVVLWSKRSLPDAAVDWSRDAHDWFTYAAAVLLGTHLLELGLAALVERFRAAAATRAPPG